MTLEEIDHDDAWLDDEDKKFLDELDDIFEEREAIEEFVDDEEIEEYWELDDEDGEETDDDEE